MATESKNEKQLVGNIPENLPTHPGLSLGAVLLELGDFILSMSDEEYTRRPSPAFTSSIGQQTRHTLDHINIFLSGMKQRVAEYDRRERGTPVETDRSAAVELIHDLYAKLVRITPDSLNEPFTAVVYLHDKTPTIPLHSTVGREIGFLLNHTIHHNALVSVMLKVMGKDVGPHFGFAPATIAYMNTVS